MEIAVYGGSDVASIDVVVRRVEEAAGAGIGSIWFPQTANLDTLTALAVAARCVPAIRLGTAVVPIQGRHPVPLALQALTVADAAGPGRFTLGLGVTHAPVSEAWFGVPYRGIVELCEEELTVLGGLLSAERSVDFAGERLSANVTLGTAAAPPPGLVLAAMGDRMLELAGRLTDGTVTWMTGPRTIARAVVPTVSAAAAAAGRPAPRIVVGLPMLVTDDPDGARRRLDVLLAPTARLRTYARALTAEGASVPSDIALVGDEDTLAQRLQELGDAGATELLANVQGDPDERARTLAFLGQRAARQGGTAFIPPSSTNV